ncbi:mechanosensitive ion channel family protein [Nonlabens marinus]|uniref:Small-conductance mechanosensitive channel n=1 Tax=Nonlabens marinus S1-08 TaxID=1454201 RepID=W8VPW2_9FLAO|nr:mechanosensitive ion channel domain-containing protein [Nonlabens marinus]BAO55304.1 small-conductance mechanosensitive channel [Nonlabens marinus S1-08]
MNEYRRAIYNWLTDGLGWENDVAELVNILGVGLVFTVILFVVYWVTRRAIITAFKAFSQRTETQFDDLLVKHGAPRLVSLVIPLVLLNKAVPYIFFDYPILESGLETFLWVLFVFLIVFIFRSVLRTINEFLKLTVRFRDKPIDSYIQVIMLVLWVLAFASILAIVANIEFIKFFTTLGAASAILLLIFKDTILGFVASIQVSINDTVRIGDWITMEKYGADGEVLQINLSTVMVQNFDNTITNLPTYALISDAYKNWRGMTDSGGRRIKRAIIIKSKSIRYLEKNDIEQLQKISLIEDYLKSRQEEIHKYNEQNEVDKSVLINGRNLTNIGVFRKYLQEYVQGHSAINKEMTIMIRQLPPTSQGMPLEIYAFSSDKRWANYEYIMADIFDHALAAVRYFDLEIFEFDTSLTAVEAVSN